MKATKHKFFSFLVLTSLTLGTSSHAYPIILEIANNRAHALEISSKLEGGIWKVEPKVKRQFKIFERSDWHVQYSTSYNKFTPEWANGFISAWVLNEPIDSFILQCLKGIGDNVKTTTLKFCKMTFEDAQTTVGYALVANEVIDTSELAANHPECQVGANERCMKLVPFSANHHALKLGAQATTIFNRPDIK